MNPLQRLRPMAERLLPDVKLIRRRPRTSFHLLLASRLLQVLICLYSIGAMDRFEMFTLFEINCGMAHEGHRIAGGRVEPLDAKDWISSGPNLEFERMREQELEDFLRHPWLWHKREQRSFGFLTVTGGPPSDDSRVYHIKNWMHLPYLYYPLLLPGTCETVPDVVQFKLAVRQRKALRDQQENAAAVGAASVVESNATRKKDDPEKGDRPEMNSLAAAPSAPEQEPLTLEPEIQVLETPTGDSFRLYGRLLKVAGVWSFLMLMCYLFAAEQYQENRLAVMSVDLFGSVFLLFTSSLATAAFHVGVNELYDL